MKRYLLASFIVLLIYGFILYFLFTIAAEISIMNSILKYEEYTVNDR